MKVWLVGQATEVDPIIERGEWKRGSLWFRGRLKRKGERENYTKI